MTLISILHSIEDSERIANDSFLDDPFMHITVGRKTDWDIKSILRNRMHGLDRNHEASGGRDIWKRDNLILATTWKMKLMYNEFTRTKC
ncbi:hypothetical protein GCM10010869_25400 [Mesorhizobium tianshanense]|nr:hypothetical protein GCM10010869_25400 [Mesorhizobium tianshanense]